MSSGDEKRPGLTVVEGARTEDGPSSIDLREANQDYEPIDLDRLMLPDGTGDDGRWLWGALGSLLVERGHLVALDSMNFGILCNLYDRRSEPGAEAEFLAWLELFCVSPQLVRDLEAARCPRGGEAA